MGCKQYGMGVDTMAEKIGHITQVIGPVVDISFEENELPRINNCIIIEKGDGALAVEAVQHVGNGTARCIAMASTDGLVRGMKVKDTGESIKVPVGKEVLGRVFNILGQAIDNAGEVKYEELYPIHSQPRLLKISFRHGDFETGIKVVDLLAPYPKGENRPLAEQGLVKQYLFKSLSEILPQSTEDIQFLQVWVKEAEKATIFGLK